MSKRVQKVVPKLMAFSLSPQYYFKRNNHYWFCFTYPVSLRSRIGATELRFSLNTISKDYARYCASTIALKLKKVMSRMSQTTNNLNHQHIKALAKEWLSDSIRTAELFYAELPPMDEGLWIEHHDTISGLKAEAEEKVALNQTANFGPTATSLIKNEDSLQSEPNHSLLERELSKASVLLLESHLDLLSGKNPRVIEQAEVAVQDVAQTPANASKGIPASTLISKVLDKFIEVKSESGDWKNSRTRMQQEHPLRLFVRIVGDMPIADISRDTIRQYKTDIQKLPSNMNKKKVLRGKTIPEILNLGLKPMSEQTAKQSLQRVGTFFKWAVQEGYLHKSPAEGISIKGTKGASKREDFQLNEIKQIFSHPHYTEGTFKESWQYWLPLMGVYTGARLGELAQLRVQDIKLEDDIWLLHIDRDMTDEENARTIKTEAAARRVAIHSDLLNLGFIEYLETVKQAGKTQLFPSLYKTVHGWSGLPSKWFTKFRRNELGINDRKKCFHSFRHNVISALLNVNGQSVSRDDIKELVGHSHKIVTYDSYFHGLTAKNLKRIVESLEWPIEVSAIKGKWKSCSIKRKEMRGD